MSLVKLTLRQQQIRDLIELGMSNAEIASYLNISVSTVKNTVMRMFNLVGASNRTELVYMTKP